MLSPSISFLLLYNLASLLFCRICNWNTCGKRGQTHTGGFFIFCWLHFSSQYDLSESYKPKNCLHINLPFGADKILQFREDTSFQNYFFSCVSVCVASVRGSLPTSSLVCSLPYVMSQCFQNRGFRVAAGTITSK